MSSNTPQYNREYFLKNKERIYKKQKERWNSLDDETKAKKIQARKDYYIKRKGMFGDPIRQYYLKNKDKFILSNRKWHKKNREKAILSLGKKCVRCGFDDYRALQIDHVNGGGTKELKDKKNESRAKYYQEVIKDKQGKYQLLCANCNWIKRYENNETRRSGNN